MVFEAKSFQNLVNRGTAQLTDVDLLVLDECHHTVGNHPFAAVINQLQVLPKEMQPQVRPFSPSPSLSLSFPFFPSPPLSLPLPSLTPSHLNLLFWMGITSTQPKETGMALPLISRLQLRARSVTQSRVFRGFV